MYSFGKWRSRWLKNYLLVSFCYFPGITPSTGTRLNALASIAMSRGKLLAHAAGATGGIGVRKGKPGGFALFERKVRMLMEQGKRERVHYLVYSNGMAYVNRLINKKHGLTGLQYNRMFKKKDSALAFIKELRLAGHEATLEVRTWYVGVPTYTSYSHEFAALKAKNKYHELALP